MKLSTAEMVNLDGDALEFFSRNRTDVTDVYARPDLGATHDTVVVVVSYRKQGKDYVWVWLPLETGMEDATDWRVRSRKAKGRMFDFVRELKTVENAVAGFKSKENQP